MLDPAQVTRIVRDVVTRVGTLRYLTYPLDDWGSLFGPITARPVETLRSAIEHAMRTRRTWDVLEPRWVPADGMLARIVERAFEEAGVRVVERPWLGSPTLVFQGTFAEYLAALDPAALTEIRTVLENGNAPVLACLHAVLGEEVAHLGYATRDLDILTT